MIKILAKWECPVCKRVGRKWVAVRTCRKNGRIHIDKFHDKNVEPIIHKIKLPVDVVKKNEIM